MRNRAYEAILEAESRCNTCQPPRPSPEYAGDYYLTADHRPVCRTHNEIFGILGCWQCRPERGGGVAIQDFEVGPEIEVSHDSHDDSWRMADLTRYALRDLGR